MTHSDQSATLSCAGEQLTLLAERAITWPARRTLLIADWHMGKADVFGRRGIAIPDGDVAHDLARLAMLVREQRSERLVVLGDLMHAPPQPGDAWPTLFAHWLQQHAALQVIVVAGNHDRVHADALPVNLADRLDWRASHVDDGPFRFDHEPGSAPGQYVLAGHIHPTCALRVGSDRLRAPAFWFREDHAVLPAFGSFTGGYNIQSAAGERIFVAGPGAVVEVTRR